MQMSLHQRNAVLIRNEFQSDPLPPLATKGYWGIGILLLTLSLVNFVKYRFDGQARSDRINRIEEAKNEKLLEDYVGEGKDEN